MSHSEDREDKFSVQEARLGTSRPGPEATLKEGFCAAAATGPVLLRYPDPDPLANYTKSTK